MLRFGIESATPIAKYFRKIYASSFMYDQHDVAEWPALAINYTTKTQFLFRINKGQLEVWDDSKVNAYTAHDKRPVPFKRMIYVGDGSTDIPCMRLVKEQGGYSVAVYPPGSPKKQAALQLLSEQRVHFVARGDYRDGDALDQQIKAVLIRMAADCSVHHGENHRVAKTVSSNKLPKMGDDSRGSEDDGRESEKPNGD